MELEKGGEMAKRVRWEKNVQAVQFEAVVGLVRVRVVQAGVFSEDWRWSVATPYHSKGLRCSASGHCAELGDAKRRALEVADIVNSWAGEPQEY